MGALGTLSRRPGRGGDVIVGTRLGIEVGEGQLDDPLGLLGGNAEQSEEVFGDLIGGLGVVAFGVVVEELAETEGSARDDGHGQLGVADGEPSGANALLDVAQRPGGEAPARAGHGQPVVEEDPLRSGCCPARPQMTTARSRGCIIYSHRGRVVAESTSCRSCGWPSTPSTPRWLTGGGDRQVFLLGDAAHLTPPFIGQGMGAGMRDAMNLAWKLAGVLRGDLPGSVLDTYQAERKPHVRTMIRRAKLMGIAMTAGGEAGSLVRRMVAPRLQHLPGLRLPVWDFTTETPPLGRSDLAVRPPLRRILAGRLCPNARLDDGRRFDDVAAGRFIVVTSRNPSAAQRARVDQRGGVLVVTGPGSELDRWLRRGRSTAAIVRPDATVLRAGHDLSGLCAALPASSVRRAAPVSTLR